MMRPAATSSFSIRQRVLFWWILFVVLQVAERIFLLRDAVAQETPTFPVLFKTFVVGLRGDFITATIALALAAAGAALHAFIKSRFAAWRARLPSFASSYSRVFTGWCLALAIVLLVLLCVDMGYYGYNQHHLDFVFLEFIGDLFIPAPDTSDPHAQALQQTDAELHDSQKWMGRVGTFLLLQALAIWGWSLVFAKGVVPVLARWPQASQLQANALLGLCLLAGAMGFHHQGPYAIRIAAIGSTVYYTLAQNPILFASEALRISMVSRERENPMSGAHGVPLDEALSTTRTLVGRGAVYPDNRYPLVRQWPASLNTVHFEKPANVIVIFVEGLDRRFLGQRYGEVAGTPFLDRLKNDSVYFENFFANGVQTSRGLFSTFCSYYPRHGAAAMKTRYAHDYLCLPSVLQRQGYKTEMVIGQHRDLNRLQMFMARNGLQQLFSESEFPPQAERTGLGMSDGALFELVGERVGILQAAERPFFLATLTLATHHPFAAPSDHPDVRALQELSDKYIGALRYTDLQLEHLFTSLQQRGLLRNTVVFVLGDHGRHEAVGSTEFEKKAGHFASPLLIWMDESLRRDSNYKPRTVSPIASQVDLAPTILALNGLVQPVAPFLGRDLSCALVRDCLEDNFAFLSSMYDNAIGVATSQGLLLYFLRAERLTDADLTFHVRVEGAIPSDPAYAARFHDMIALYETANVVLDQNRIWSWKE
ncbi:MAG: LTA synthase family protein, partial [Nitrospiraceae bacterium]